MDQLQATLGNKLSIRLVMGGLLPSWERFHDETNYVSRPVQMGPVWMHAGQLTGRAIYHQLWTKDPPASSYPACTAVKCAGLQSPEAGFTYFKLLQEAGLGDGKNIASWPVLQGVAETMTGQYPFFNLPQFITDYQQGHGAKAFSEDLAIAASHRVTRFPTLLLEADRQRGIVLAGYRRYEGLQAAIEQAFPGLM
jgi:protein-disulfide isomerase-like protein with CxxC motif